MQKRKIRYIIYADEKQIFGNHFPEKEDNMTDFSEVEKNIGYVFQDKSLLKKALTHTSYAYENKIESNEKLEFLGDAILEIVVSKYLFRHYQQLSEGEMTKVRASVVCEDSLYQIAKKHNFSDFLFLGKSEIINNGKERPAILADSVEAVIAAIYLDSNMDSAEKFILSNLKQTIEVSTKHVGMKDYKTVLQEKLQVHGDIKIEYQTIHESGPDHKKVFTVELKVNGKVVSHGTGNTKKSAEMNAAKQALEKQFHIKN